MAQESVVFGIGVAVVIVGLAVLLYGEAIGPGVLVYAGGVVVLAAVGLIALAVARMDGPTGH